MPREIIKICVSGAIPLFEAGAAFIATLAHPAAEETNLRVTLWQALCRDYLLTYADMGHNLGSGAAPLATKVEEFFKITPEAANKAIEVGGCLLSHRIIVARRIVMPLLRQELSGKKIREDDMPVTLNQRAIKAGEDLGWEGDVQQNVKNRIWRPSRPVAHAAAAYVSVVNRITGGKGGGPFQSLLWDANQLVKTVELSERFRQALLALKKPKMKDGETIQFGLA